MKSGKRKAMIVALICIACGIILSLVAFLLIGFNISKLNRMEEKAVTHTVKDSFSKIDINIVEADIKILPSNDGNTRVVCNESDKIVHLVYVENGTLKIDREDLRAWYEHIGFFWSRMSVAVYLPDTEYEKVHLESVSGNITLQSQFSFDDATVKTVSGDIALSTLEADTLRVESTSGKLDMNRVNVEKTLQLNSVSGDILWQEGTARALDADSTSGNIDLSYCLVENEMLMNTVSGNITFTYSDAASLTVKSVSGNVNGTLLSDKEFITDTTSGDVRVPYGLEGGACRISTVSGNIIVSIQPKERACQ